MSEKTVGRLGRKLIMPVMITILAVILISSILRATRDHALLESQLVAKGEVLLNLASETFRQPLWSFDETAITDGVNALMGDREVESVLLTDQWNVPLGTGDKKRTSDPLRNLVLEKDILHGDLKIGHITLTLTRHWLDLQQQQNMFISFVWFAVMAVVPLIVLFRKTRSILRPLSVLRDAMTRIASGNLSDRIGPISDDELGDVALHFDEMTESLQQTHDRITYMAYHDALTGLYNREMLRLEAEVWNRNPGHRMVLYFLDVDNFKLVNDSLGHQIGDKLLRQLGERFRTLKRPNVDIYHFGGDKYAFLLKEPSGMTEIEALADGMLAMANHHFREDTFIFDATASIGIAMAPEDGNTVDELYRKADIAMYKAKENGRSHYVFFNKDMAEAVIERQKIMAYLKSAIANRQLSLVYQPQVNASDGRVNGMEALIRWNSPELGMVPPNRFIPIAEDSGLIVPIGEWVFLEVAALLDAHPELCRDGFRIALNVSGIQFRQELLVKTARQLARHAGHIELEVTESVLLHSYDICTKILGDLREMGYTISLDDFGTGYSSLSYLRELPLDVVKIDKMFIDDISVSSRQRGIVAAILAIARELGLEVVAEGVEHREQRDLLRENGCDRIQGYYYFKPLPFSELAKQIDFSSGVIREEYLPE